MSKTKCPNCNTTIGGFMSYDALVSQEKTTYINKYLELQIEGFCTSCQQRFLNQVVEKFGAKKNEIEERIKESINQIPLLTSPAPKNWEYEIIDLITTQTTSGTGFITELSRSFNDLLGRTSGSSNSKIKEATELCKAALRLECMNNGGNAILSVDIDFSEIGSGSTNMLMVCMAGTAIKVSNTAALGEKRSIALEQLIAANVELDHLLDDYNTDYLGPFPITE